MTAVKDDQFEWHRQLVRDGNLTPTERLVALALWDHYDPKRDEAVYPGRLRLADELNLSPSTIDRALKALRGSGWITRVRRGSSGGRRRLADEYRLTYPSRSRMKSTHDHSSPVVSDPEKITRHPCVDHSSPMRLSVSTSDDPIDHEINHEQITAHAPTLTLVNGGFGSAVEPEKSLRKESSPKPDDIDPWSGAPIPDPSQCHDHRPAGGFGCPNCRAA